MSIEQEPLFKPSQPIDNIGDGEVLGSVAAPGHDRFLKNTPNFTVFKSAQKTEIIAHNPESDSLSKADKDAQNAISVTATELIGDQPRKKYQKSQKFTRWGRKDDKKAFIILNEYLIRTNMTLESFFSCYMTIYKYILFKIAKNGNWLRNHQALYQRMAGTYEKAKNFSVRNKKKLYSLLVSHTKIQNIDIEKVYEDFPGMTRQALLTQIQFKLADKSKHKVRSDVGGGSDQDEYIPPPPLT